MNHQPETTRRRILACEVFEVETVPNLSSMLLDRNCPNRGRRDVVGAEHRGHRVVDPKLTAGITDVAMKKIRKVTRRRRGIVAASTKPHDTHERDHKGNALRRSQPP
jgi:hypothetical protein